MTQSILVTGGAGFIGSNLANSLVNRGHTVRILDILSPQIHGPNPELSPLFLSLNPKIQFIRGSVLSEQDLLQALDGVDTVVHLAAETGTGQSMYAIRHYSDVNIGGTALLLDLISNRSLPVKKLVVASSRAVYGEGKYRCATHGIVYPDTRSGSAMDAGDFSAHCPSCGLPAEVQATDENSPVSPVSFYGVTKLTQEQMVLTVGKSLGISAIALRYQNVYGPGQSLSNPYTGILSIFSTRIRNKKPINIFEDGMESRDFVYIDDVVQATVYAIEHQPQIVDAFNIGTGVPTDVLRIANSLQELLETKVETKVSGQYRVGDIRHNYADTRKAKDHFGFSSSVDIEQGLREFVSWVRSEEIQPDKYESSLKELASKGLFK